MRKSISASLLFSALAASTTSSAQARLAPLTFASIDSILTPGTYNVASPMSLDSTTRVVGTGATTLVSTVTPSDVYQGSALLAQPPQETDGILDDAPAVGGTSVDVSLLVAPVTETFLRLAHGFSSQVFLIKDVQVVDDGHYTVTLDRAVRLPFVAGDTVIAYPSVPHDIHIDGGDMSIGGTGDLYLELFAARDSTVRDLQISGAYGSLRPFTFMMSFDIGGYENVYDHLTIDGTSNAEFVSAPVHEAGERALISDVFCTNLTGNGPALVDCIDSGLESVSTSNAPNGWGQGIGSQGDSFGSISSWSSDGESSACLYGLVIGKAKDTQVINFTATSSLSTGVFVTAPADGTELEGITTVDSRDQGLLVSGQGPTGTTIRGWKASEMNGYSTAAVTTPDSGPVLFDHFAIASGGQPYAGSAFDTSGTRTTIRNGMIQLTTPERVAVIARAGVTQISRVQVEAQALWGTFCVYVFSGATLRLGPGNDFSQCDTPIYAEPGAYLDHGTIAVDGTTSVTVPFPDLNSNDTVTLSLIQQSTEAVPPPPVVSPVPGVGFVVVASDPQDTSVYAYAITPSGP